MCAKHNNEYCDTIRNRPMDAVMSGVHAVDARYHRKCVKLFHAIPAFTI